MALRNTSERYEYIYGSNVRKLETDTAGKQTAKAVPAKKNVRRPEQRRTGNKAADSESAAAIQKNEAKFHTPVGKLKFPNSLPNFYPIPCINSGNFR